MATEDRAGGTAPGRLAHGQLCYLQIPAADAGRSAAFYAQVFGWRAEPGQTGFEAPGLIGQWVSDRPPSAEAGLLAWIHVEGIDEALARAAASGGAVLQLPAADGRRWLATVADPAGNVIGLVQHGPR